MKLILARHGNTFSSGEKVLRVGSRTDLPLVKEGQEQARRVAQYLLENNMLPTMICCGPLKRTVQFAEIISESLKGQFTLHVDSRLNEIDYGCWEGLTNEEIIERFGRKALENWDRHSIFPPDADWKPSEKHLIEEVESFTAELTASAKDDDICLAVSSNGRLRYFLMLIPGEFERRKESGDFKVKTGHICELEFISGTWRVNYWNRGC
ncbi:MAG: histidine phosphatase family protein [Candidatus Dadabacteria bacterium]|nr:MAG: histidine phosphatase family protein [Candidatus Dadabacteria bacterium]